MSANTELVDRFIAAWKTEDVDHIVSFFHDDAVYTNVPIDPPNRGIEAIRTMIGGFLGMAQAMEFVVHHSAENAAAGIDTPLAQTFEQRAGVCQDYSHTLLSILQQWYIKRNFELKPRATAGAAG